MREETILKLIELKNTRLCVLEAKHFTRNGYDNNEIDKLKKEINKLESKLK